MGVKKHPMETHCSTQKWRKQDKYHTQKHQVHTHGGHNNISTNNSMFGKNVWSLRALLIHLLSWRLWSLRALLRASCILRTCSHIAWNSNVDCPKIDVWDTWRHKFCDKERHTIWNLPFWDLSNGLSVLCQNFFLPTFTTSRWQPGMSMT